MSEYKRLISYIYNYEKGIKKNNVGFAKIELRNGQCKISINIKATSLNGQNLRAYVFYRQDKNMIQIPLTEGKVDNGVFEWKGITSATDVMNSGYSFEELCGVIVFHSMQKFYATEWDDQPIILNKIVEWNKNITNDRKMNERATEQSKNNKQSVENVRKPRIIEVPKDEITYVDKKGKAEKQVRESQEEIVKSILRSIDIGLELFRDQSDHTNETVQAAQLSPVYLEKPEKAIEKKVLSQQVSKETATLVGYRFIDWYRSQESGFSQDEVAITSQYIEEHKEDDEHNDEDAAVTVEECINAVFAEQDPQCGEHEEEEWKERLEEASKKKISTAERMLKKYPAINPFEEDDILACVRIEPGDIGLFPIENWVLGNNSFLLHGYYNFRHLIFAKRKTIDGEEFILGVPGVYQNREKFMAKMFGFTSFKCCKNTDQKTGEFGYWYVKINM